MFLRGGGQKRRAKVPPPSRVSPAPVRVPLPQKPYGSAFDVLDLSLRAPQSDSRAGFALPRELSDVETRSVCPSGGSGSALAHWRALIGGTAQRRRRHTAGRSNLVGRGFLAAGRLSYRIINIIARIYNRLCKFLFWLTVIQLTGLLCGESKHRCYLPLV
jgi:hypothetical protein